MDDDGLGELIEFQFSGEGCRSVAARIPVFLISFPGVLVWRLVENASSAGIPVCL